LCHSVFGTAAQLAHDIGVPLEEINYLAAGINHMAFYLKFERNGEDLYPLLQRVIAEKRVPDWNRVRYEVFSRFGYFVTESSEHFSEYVPWFIKRDRPDLIEEFNVPLDEYIRREMKKVFPDQAFVELPPSHEIFHQKYDFNEGIPKIHEHDNKPPQAFGLFVGDRLVCFYTYETDLGDGWEDIDVHNDPEELRQKALKMGANIIAYVFGQ